MDILSWHQLIGYAGSVLVATSMAMRSFLKFRLINLFGALCFATYGLLIGAYPVAALNSFILLIDLYYLRQMLMSKEYFTLLEIRYNSEYLSYFLRFYEREIKKFQPDFAGNLSEHHLVFFILRNLVPAGLLIAEQRGAEALFVQLDFVIPGYRDFKTGKFVFIEKAAVFKAKGLEKIYSAPGNDAHQRYLQRMGFVPEGEVYCLMLAAT